MMIVTLISWWYSRGWLWALQQIEHRLKHIGDVFAVTVLIRTWFAPWKQIYTSAGTRNFLQASIDNGVSRVIGGIVRTSVLLVALIWAIVVTLLGVVLFIVWPLIPISIIVLPLLTLRGVIL